MLGEGDCEQRKEEARGAEDRNFHTVYQCYVPRIRDMTPYYSENGIAIYHGDCLQVMPECSPASFDACITDPPYGTTACAWDSVIPFVPMWAELDRLIQRNGALVLFGAQPFTSALVMSNVKAFKYEWVWKKSHATGQLNLNVRPMNEHDNILVFGGERLTYNLQLTNKPKGTIRAPTRMGLSDCYGSQREYDRTIPIDMRAPTTVLEFGSVNHGERGLHPTQKPINLMRYLIQTYTSAGDAILDFTCGSGTTLRAAKDTGRRAVGIDISEECCEIAAKRLSQEVFNFAEV